MIQAVCFDMDGVLVDSERLSPLLIIEAARLQGCSMTLEQSKQSIGGSIRSLSLMLHELFADKIDSDRFMKDWFDLTMNYVRREGVPLKPHARETLASLRRRGIPVALCTSNIPEVVHEYLQLASLSDAFDVIVTGDMVPRSKPDPAIFRKGAELLGVSPSHCAGVEDSLNGVMAVRAAGMTCVMIPDVHPFSEAYAPYVDLTLSSLAELEQALWSSDACPDSASIKE